MRIIRKLYIPGTQFLADLEVGFCVVDGAIKIKQEKNREVPVPILWIEADTNNVLVKHEFRVIATGEAIPDGWAHVRSLCFGRFEMHVYVNTWKVQLPNPELN